MQFNIIARTLLFGEGLEEAELNVITWLEFEVAYFEAAVSYFSHNTTGNPLLRLSFYFVYLHKIYELTDQGFWSSSIIGLFGTKEDI